jgi:hypothetical protein
VTTSAPRARRLPLLPAPFLDETFGSWIFRAAVDYHMTTREFAKGIIALERLIVRPYPRLSSLPVTPERAARPNAHLISLKG